MSIFAAEMPIPKGDVICTSGTACTCNDISITFPIDICFTTWYNNKHMAMWEIYVEG